MTLEALALEGRRMKTVRQLRVEEVSDEVLEAVVRHQGLREMKVFLAHCPIAV